MNERHAKNGLFCFQPGDKGLTLCDKCCFISVWMLHLWTWLKSLMALGRCSELTIFFFSWKKFKKKRLIFLLMACCMDAMRIFCNDETERLKNDRPYQQRSPSFSFQEKIEQEVMERLLVLCASIIHWQPMRGWPFWPRCSVTPRQTHSSLPLVLHLAQCPQVVLKRQTSLDSAADRENGRNNSRCPFLVSTLLLLFFPSGRDHMTAAARLKMSPCFQQVKL